MPGLFVGYYNSFIGESQLGGFLELYPANANSSHTAPNVSLLLGNALIVQSALHTLADNFNALQTNNTLVAAKGIHGHTVANLVLQALSTLVTANGSSAHLADNVKLDFSLHLTVASVSHVLTSLTPTPELHNYLVSQAAAHGHTADNGVLAIQAYVEVSPSIHHSNAATITIKTHIAGSHLPIFAESREYIIPAEDRTIHY